MSTTAAAANAAALSRRPRRPGRRMLIALVLAALLAAGAAYAAVALTRDQTPLLAVGAPAQLSEADMPAVAEQVGHAVYGVGPQPGATLEVTRGSRGEVWVRYLSGDAAIGDRRADFLTVGTYRRAGALAAARAAAEGAQTRSAELPGGGLMLWSLDRPTSVYVARPGTDLLVEVYSPDPEQAKGLVRGGAVIPLS
jgi:hypothetical protein